MQQDHKPYVGITGITEHDQVSDLVYRIDPNLFGPHILAAGIPVSCYTAAGKKPKRWASRYPAVDDIPAICNPLPNVEYIVHYWTKDLEDVADQVIALYTRLESKVHGFQLNMEEWPDIAQLRAIRSTLPNGRLIMPITQRVLDKVDSDRNRLYDMIAGYLEQGAFTDVLYDLSGGNGHECDLRTACDRIIRLFNLPVGVGLAGGFCAEKLWGVFRNFSDCGRLSLDMEGQLRTPVDEPNTNKLDPYKAYAAAVGGLSMLRQMGSNRWV